MKKFLVLILVLLVMVSFSSMDAKAYDTFTIDVVEAHDLQKNRGIVYLYKDIIGYEDKEMTKPIYNYVASCIKFEVGTEMSYQTLKHFSNYNVFVIDGKPDTSWHNYEVK